MYLIIPRSETDINQAEAINLSKIRNKFPDLVRRASTFDDDMKGLLTFAGALKLDYKVKLVNEGIKDILYNTLLSEYLPTRTPATSM